MAAQPGQQACLQFISPDSNVPTVNLTVVNRGFHFVYTPSYIYYTPDGNYTVQAICHCPLHPTADCSVCSDASYSTDASVCITGYKQHKDCGLNYINDPASYCARLNFDLIDHFGVIKFNQIPELQGQIDFYIDGVLFPFLYRGTSLQTFSFSSNFTATIVSNTASTFVPDFGVYDIIDQGDMYMLSSSDVNGIQDFDPRKVGYIKGSQAAYHISPTFSSDIIANLDPSAGGCDHDKFTITTDNVSPHKILSQNSNKRLSLLSPGSYVTGNPFVNHQTIPSANYYNTRLYAGVALMGFTGPLTIGFDSNHNPLHYETALNSILYELQGVLRIRRNVVFMSDAITFPCNETETCFLFLGTEVGTSATGYALCFEDEYLEMLNGNTSSSLCAGRVFTAVGFPDQRTHTYTIFDQGNSLINISYTANDTDTYFDQELHLAPQSGDFLLSLSFLNMTVNFVTQSVKPKIISVDVNETGFATVCAMSLSVKGDCYLSTVPFVTQAQSILLSTQKDCSTFPPDTVAFSGNLTYIINCRQYQSTYSVLAKFDNNPDVLGPITTSTEGDLSDDHSVLSDFANPFDWDVSNPFAWVTKILLVVLSAGAVITLLVVTVKLGSYLIKRKMVKRPITVRISDIFRPS